VGYYCADPGIWLTSLRRSRRLRGVWKVARGGTHDRAERIRRRFNAGTLNTRFLRLVERAIPQLAA
jgi:hypothetical protein